MPDVAPIVSLDGSPCGKKSKMRAKRGPTSLTLGVKCNNGEKVQHNIEFNTKGQPKGESRKLTATARGILCRAHAPINCRSWKHVPKSCKDKIMEVIETNYKCEDSKNWKKAIMRKVSNRFRYYKNEMYTKFILPNIGKPEKLRDPPVGYTTITPDQWRDFVDQRTSVGWAAVRRKAQQTRNKNKFQHRLSRKGYAGLEEELQQINNTTMPIPRHILWKKARQKMGYMLMTLQRKQ